MKKTLATLAATLGAMALAAPAHADLSGRYNVVE